MSAPEGYCGGCYGEAKKKGRPVRVTDVYKYALCSLCESRMRNGLVHYIPSNGTEGHMFETECEKCRHYSTHPEGYGTCAFGILDKMVESGWEDRDSAKSWYDPADLRTKDHEGNPICPAQCLRFTDKNDPNGNLREPPPKDCAGQMFLGEVLDVPERKIPEKASV